MKNGHHMNAIWQNVRRRRAGQTMIFLLLVCVILTFVVLWNFDLHKVVTVKLRAQNGADAAALAAARWQGITLNLVGHMNVLQAVAIHDALSRGDTDFPEARAIADLAARLCYVGPVTALAAAQQGAKNNRIYDNVIYAGKILKRGTRASDRYADWFPAPYTNAPSPPTAWDDYGTMLSSVAAQGIAVMPGNARFHDEAPFADGQMLLSSDFYSAIASRSWCWFYRNEVRYRAWSRLRTYTNYRDWPALDVDETPPAIANSEYLGLGLTSVRTLGASCKTPDKLKFQPL